MSSQVHLGHLSLFWDDQDGSFQEVSLSCQQKKESDRIFSRSHSWNISLFGGTVQWLRERKLWEMKEPKLILAYSNYGLSQTLDSLPVPLASWVLVHFHQHQREGRGNKGRWNANESILPLVSSSALKYTTGRQLRLFCGFQFLMLFLSLLLPGNIEWAVWKWSVGWKKNGGGKLPPTVPSSKKRKGNYMLSGSMPHRVVQVLLNKLMFGSILSPQN